MAINYSWNINGLQVYPSQDDNSNVVFQIDYEYKGIDSENELYQYPLNGGVKIGEPSGDFIEFDDLTEAIVIGWLENVLDIEQMQSRISEQIETQKNPPVIGKTPPWEVQENNNTI